MDNLILSGDFYYDYNYLKQDLKEINNFFNYNNFKVLLNFEGTLNVETKSRKSVILEMSQNAIKYIPENSILLLNNNHSTDGLDNGVTETIKKLSENKLKFLGLNSKIHDVESHTFLEENVFIATVGWKNEECITNSKKKYFCNEFNKNNILKLLEKANKKQSFKILSVHAGYEFERYPLPLHVGLSRYAIDLGFDIVFFNHSHCIQEYEFYKGKLIHYGLGNFYFGTKRKYFPRISDESIVIKINRNKDIRYTFYKIKYDSDNDFTKLYPNEENFDLKKSLGNLKNYSKNYSQIRIRKKNPRPIMYYEKDIQNEIKYFLWKFVVDVLGILGIRKMVKKALNW